MTNDIQTRIVAAAVARIESEARNLIDTRIREFVEASVSLAGVTPTVEEALRKQIESADLSNRVDAMLGEALDRRVAVEGAAIRESLFEAAGSGTIEPDALARHLWADFDRRQEITQSTSTLVTERYFAEGSARLEQVGTDATIRIMDYIVANNRETILSRVVESVSAKLVAQLGAEATVAASTVPESPAEAIRDDAEALAQAIVNGGPF